MSIKVSSVCKRFGTQSALDRVSFEWREGMITGFIGPNGAGKSTMMKILCGLLLPEEGTASVAGYDVRTHMRDIRRILGYLPEENPLYPNMYVREYLHYCAGLYRLGNRSERIRRVIEQTGLGPEQHKTIGSLSKGYRQRVGLAQALIHDPKVLILDEPTTGLDPNQVVEIRALIAEMATEKTVMLSTHNLQEVESMCRHIVIISQGHIVADGTKESLLQSSGEAIPSLQGIFQRSTQIQDSEFKIQDSNPESQILNHENTCPFSSL